MSGMRRGSEPDETQVRPLRLGDLMVHPLVNQILRDQRRPESEKL